MNTVFQQRFTKLFIRLVVLGYVFGVLVACGGATSTTTPPTTDPTTATTIAEEEYFEIPLNAETKDVSVVLPGETEPTQLALDVVGDVLVYQGDIAVAEANTANLSTQSIVIKATNRIWPNNTIHYVIDAKLEGRKADIEKGIALITDTTNLKIEARTDQKDYVKFVESNGCWSYVGKIGGEQEIGLSSGCGTGSIAHEILHAAGIKHEQARTDRNNFVKVVLANIKKGKEHNFNQAKGFEDNGSYDFESIMHYPWYAFSTTRNCSTDACATILPADSNRSKTSLGQRLKLSAGDIAGVNKLYPEATTPAPTQVASVYTDCAFTGTSAELKVGFYNPTQLAALGLSDSTISSVKVPEGLEVILYGEDWASDEGEQELTLTSDASCLIDNDFNDATFAIEVAIREN